MENAVLDLLNIEIGKSETTKQQVLIVKRSKAKWIMCALLIPLFVGLCIMFNSFYDVSLVRRAGERANMDADVQAAAMQQKVLDVAKDLESHLVSEIKERDDTLRYRDIAMGKVDQTLNEHHAILTSLLVGLNDTVREVLTPLGAKIQVAWTNDADSWNDKEKRKAKVKVIMDEVQAKFMAVVDSAAVKFRAAVNPLKDEMANALNKIADTEEGRGDAAAGRLEHIQTELAAGAVAAAAANSRVEEHLLDDKDYSPHEQHTMIQNYFIALEHRITELTAQLDEVIAAGETADGILPEVLTKIRQLSVALGSGAISLETVSHELSSLVSRRALPPPVNPDLGIHAYIQSILEAHPSTAKELGIPEFNCSTQPTCFYLTAPCFRKERTEGHCYPFISGTQKCPRGTQRCTVFPHHDGLAAQSVRRDLANLQVLQEEYSRWKGKQITDADLFNVLKDRVRKQQVPVLWLVKHPKYEETEKEEPLTKEQKKWLRQKWKALRDGEITKDQLYGEVMERYNEGKISFDSMSRLSKTLFSADALNLVNRSTIGGLKDRRNVLTRKQAK
jgi:hypothetical protein